MDKVNEANVLDLGKCNYEPNKAIFDNQLSMTHPSKKTAVSWLGFCFGILLAPY